MFSTSIKNSTHQIRASLYKPELLESLAVVLHSQISKSTTETAHNANNASDPHNGNVSPAKDYSQLSLPTILASTVQMDSTLIKSAFLVLSNAKTAPTITNLLIALHAIPPSLIPPIQLLIP
jgi:hypothetical protein